jgi:dipeptidyl aminopeptidase/acylaminoacyl peptidase
VPPGPITSETQGRSTPVRTLTDLLQDDHDMLLFEHHLRCQLAIVDLAGARTDVGVPAVWTSVAPSPDGKWLLTGRTERPYSTLVGWDAFPERIEVRGLDGDLVREVAKLPLRDDIPIQGVARGRRDVEWQDSGRPGEPALLVWAEAQDEGDPKKKVPHRDRLMTWAAPFEPEGAGAPKELLRLEHRFTGLRWLERAQSETQARALVSEYDRDARWSRTWLATLEGAALAGAPKKVWDRSVKDVYGHPGTPLDATTASGRRVARVRGGALLLAGRGASPQGDLPFLDRLDLATLETKRLWRCEPGRHEEVVEALDDEGTRLLTRRETPDEPPNYRLQTLGATPTSTAVTAFPDPTPELRGVKKELLTYERQDGVKLSGTLYTPAGWTPEQGKLPLLLWAYPQEFNDAGTAGQVSGSPWRFTRFAGPSHLFLVTQGWAVLDDATMPVVGSPETVNDAFVPQIVASAKAAIDHLATKGVADPARVAVAGHSYGAFMTANLLAHCDLFKAGVARSGAYNRTLTPFGFQGERRTLWEARETYALLSPFTWADRIKTPLLLIHGQLDPNPGTFPLQSERLFHAIQGHGGTARLVVLPHEGHGYIARESVLHVLAETIDWLDRHVKQAKVAGGE